MISERGLYFILFHCSYRHVHEIRGARSHNHVQSAGVRNDGRRLCIPPFHDSLKQQPDTPLGRRDRDDVRAAGKANRRVSATETGRCETLIYRNTDYWSTRKLQHLSSVH